MQRFVLEWKPLGRYIYIYKWGSSLLIVLSVFFYHHIRPTCNYIRHKVTTWRIYWGYILPPQLKRRQWSQHERRIIQTQTFIIWLRDQPVCCFQGKQYQSLRWMCPLTITKNRWSTSFKPNKIRWCLVKTSVHKRNMNLAKFCISPVTSQWSPILQGKTNHN